MIIDYVFGCENAISAEKKSSCSSCKIGLRNILFIFGRKMVVCLFVCCNTLTDSGLLKKNQAEKDAFKEKIIRCTTWELLLTPTRVLIICRFSGFTKVQLTKLLDRRSVLLF